jgi:hypothetical protein
LVQSRDVTWALAHDTVADELRRAPSALLVESPAELLFAYWRHPERLSVPVLEQLALIAGRDDSAAMAVRLGRAALGAPRIREAGIRGRALARRVARMSGRPEWEATVLRGLGFWGRQSERTRIAGTVVAMLVLTGMVGLAAKLQPRVIISTPAMAEQPGLSLPVTLVVQPRVHIENGFGRPWTRPVPLRVRSDLAATFGDGARERRRLGPVRAHRVDASQSRQHSAAGASRRGGAVVRAARACAHPRADHRRAA